MHEPLIETRASLAAGGDNAMRCDADGGRESSG
jgi:hypothetical protein